MNSPQETYTYRSGQKVHLRKRLDQFVVRALPDKLIAAGIPAVEQLSSSSSRVKCAPENLEALMTQARTIAPAYHAYEVVETNEDFLISDRILVSFDEALSDEALGTFLGKYGLVLKEQYSDRDFLLQLTSHTGMNPVKLVVKLTEEEPIVFAVDHDLNALHQPYAVTLPTDPAYRRQWHLHEQLTNTAFDKRASAQCEKAWHQLGHFGSDTVVVGLADDGCKVDHPDFNSANKFAGWGYFVGTRLVTNIDVDAKPGNMYVDGSDHGTNCAGVIAAEIDAALTVGAAPGCKLLPIRWESDNGALFISDSKLLSALNYLADKVDIMSNSWGITPVGTWSSVVIRRITDLTKTGGRRNKGIIFLWAAGNENCPVDHTATVDVPYTPGWDFKADGSQVWVGVETTRYFRNNLTDIPGLMHIAAINSLAQRSHYSNYGKGVVLCAPSNNVHAYYRLPVKGLGVTTTSGMSGFSTDDFGGTSSATPLVAGIAALVISANPNLSALEVISILKRTASKDLNLAGYAKTPAANYDPRPVWDVSPIAPFDQGAFKDTGDPDGTWSPWFGHGKVDAFAAVVEAQKRLPAPPPAEEKKTLTYQSAPKKAIPDNSAAGLTDTIVVKEAVNLQGIQVSLKVTHTWVGDLRVQLTSPTGTPIVLHNRTGSSQKSINQVYTLESLPALAPLKNTTTKGEWKLFVQDMAARDTGTLEAWGLTLQSGPAGALVLEDAQGAEIPDFDNRGVVRTLTIPEGTTIQKFSVFVDVSHPAISDLRVSLVTPQGIPITLHDQSGRGGDMLSRTWSDQDTLNLQSLRGKPGGGAWQLRVADLTTNNRGKLNRWRLTVNG
jgi:subtilisin-like proprotein convertase family protein